MSFMVSLVLLDDQWLNSLRFDQNIDQNIGHQLILRNFFEKKMSYL